jgi:hypothetical protein
LRREFNRTVKRLYYGKDSRVATSSLSRAYQRLEDRQYIVRFGGRWKFTDSNPSDNGMMLALLAWAQKRELYALLGLKVHRLIGCPKYRATRNPPKKASKNWLPQSRRHSRVAKIDAQA